jgi:hypothetical protein
MVNSTWTSSALHQQKSHKSLLPCVRAPDIHDQQHLSQQANHKWCFVSLLMFVDSLEGLLLACLVLKQLDRELDVIHHPVPAHVNVQQALHSWGWAGRLRAVKVGPSRTRIRTDPLGDSVALSSDSSLCLRPSALTTPLSWRTQRTADRAKSRFPDFPSLQVPGSGCG